MTEYLAPPPGAPTRDLDPPDRALAIGAHPDDIDFGCGGTLAKWAAAGTEITELVLTDGSKGSWDRSIDHTLLVGIRQGEQREAARALGAADVRYLGHIDGELDSGLGVRAEVCRVIREVRPQVVLGHDPWKMYRLHPDHRNAGLLAVEGIVAARDPHFFPGQTAEPHRPAHLLLWEAQVVDHLEDVEAWMAVKIKALLCHASQWESTMSITGPAENPVAQAQRTAFETKIRERASEAGVPGGPRYAEAFKRIDRL
ncbi:MAG: PIG-L deacetylase family protein [Acidimicrobiia bacterium]